MVAEREPGQDEDHDADPALQPVEQRQDQPDQRHREGRPHHRGDRQVVRRGSPRETRSPSTYLTDSFSIDRAK